VLMLDMKTPLPEDSDLECFLPVNKALRFALAETAVFAVMFRVAKKPSHWGI